MYHYCFQMKCKDFNLLCALLSLKMGYQLNFIIDHHLESVDAFDAILYIIIGLHIFTELM